MKLIYYNDCNCVWGYESGLAVPLRRSPDNVVTTCWSPSLWERIKILFGQDVYVAQRTNGDAPQRVKVTVRRTK